MSLKKPRILPFLLATVLLLACGHHRYDGELALVDSLQKLDSAYLSDSLLQPIVRYYDRYGTRNQQARAHYLLGRTYHIEGLLPQALDAYQTAAERADTTARDRDYSLLMKVYGQEVSVFDQLSLSEEVLHAADWMERYAILSNDTLSAIYCSALRARAFYSLNRKDDVIACSRQAANLIRELGHPEYSASYQGIQIPVLLERGLYKEAKAVMDDYEANSGFFDRDGNALTPEAVVYYNNKGSYYLGINRVDSAEYYFLRQLKEGHDYNNQIGAHRSLSLLYEHLGQYAKAYYHASRAYEVNDSAYLFSVAQNLQQLQTSYDYQKHQQEAEKLKADNRRKQHVIVVSLLVIAILAVLICMGVVYSSLKKRLLQGEVSRLQEQALGYEDTEQKHQRQIEHLARQLETATTNQSQLTIQYESQLAQMKYSLQRAVLERERLENAEKILYTSPAYLQVKEKLQTGSNLSSKDWADISSTLNDIYPSFTSVLRNTFHVKEDFLKVCMLMKMRFANKDIAILLHKAPQTISTNCTREMEKAFGKDTQFANWRDFILSL